MNAKLTLTLDKELIEGVKEYAKSSNLSLSKIVERYFKSLLDVKQNQETDFPASIDVSGMMPTGQDYDLIGDYTNYLIDRYQ
jgi:hypothetical protein